jgi:large subunit ribosomal protein L20
MRLFASRFGGAHSRLTRIIIQQRIRALASANQDRGGQKRNFRRLWVTRINAAIREGVRNIYYASNAILINTLNLNYNKFINTLNLNYNKLINTLNLNYNKLINNLYKRQLLLNRKMLSQLAILNRYCFFTISNTIIASL